MRRKHHAFIMRQGIDELMNKGGNTPNLRRIFANAVFAEVDNSILIPRVGDTPAVVQNNQLASVAFQFRSFSSNATTRVLLSGIQRASLGDLQAAYGILGLITAGATVYTLKAKLAGIEPKMDIDTLLYEGITRSGVAGLFWENALALMPTESNVHSGPWKATTAMFGPSYSSLQEALDLLYGLSDGQLSQTDRRRALHLTPFANIFWLRSLFEKLYGIEQQ